MEVSATGKTKDEEGNVTGEREVNVNYEFGEDLESSAELFGADVVYNKFLQSAVIDLQAVVRRAIGQGKTDDEIQEVVSAWMPGVRARTAKTPSQKIMDLLKGKTPEEIAAILAQVSDDVEDLDDEEAA